MSGIRDPEIYRTVLESMQTGVCIVDMENKILFWNDGAERITGYLRHEVVGRNCGENFQMHCTQTKCDSCHEHCPLVTARHTARPVEASAFVHHKDGHSTPVHIWAVPIRNEHGSIIGAVQSFEHFRAINAAQGDRRVRSHTWLDEQTGIANRATMQVHLREAFTTLSEGHVPFGVLCVRLDEWDHLGAKYGKEAALSILRAIAQTLENTLRPTDFVGRWAEDQFLAILGGCRETSLDSVCERVRKMIHGSSIEWWGGDLSAGALSLISMAPQSEDSVETLMERLQQLLSESSGPKAKAASAGTDGETSQR